MNARLKRWLASGLAALWLGCAAALLVGVGLPQRAAYTGVYQPQSGYVAPEVGAVAPSFQASLLSGDPFDLAQRRGQWVLLNFWATWCAPCRAEMPELQQLAASRADVQVIGINQGESASHISLWLSEQPVSYPIVLDEEQGLSALYQVRGLPSTFIIAPDGTIRTIIYGAATAAALESHLSLP